MTDIVTRVRALTIGSNAAVLWNQANEAADEIQRLRGYLIQILRDADAHDVLPEWWFVLDEIESTTDKATVTTVRESESHG